MSKKQFEKTCRAVMKSLRKGTIMIVAVRKDNAAVMKNDVYNTQYELNNAVDEWKSKGYRVYFTRG